MKRYHFVPKAGSYSFNKQEAIVFASLRALSSGTIEELAQECMDRGLRTKQSPERIVAYYLVDLRKLGLVTSTGSSARKVTVVIDEDENVEDDSDDDLDMSDANDDEPELEAASDDGKDLVEPDAPADKK